MAGRVTVEAAKQTVPTTAVTTVDACVRSAFSGQLLRTNVKWFRRGLVFEAHRLVYHSTLGSRVMKEKN